jgi:hypothetical protein
MLLALASLALAQDPGIAFEVHGMMEPGRPMNVSVIGAEPNQRFYVVYSDAEGVSCPLLIAPMCTDILFPIVLRTAIANDEGNAYSVFNFPDVDFMFMQVVTATDTSNVVLLDAVEPNVWVNDG